MKRGILLLFMMWALASLNAYAQREIWGIIVDDDGKPVQGAVVRVKNEKDSVITDAKGRFWLSKTYPNKPVIVSKLSYTDRDFLPGPVLYFEIVLSKRKHPIRLLKLMEWHSATDRSRHAALRNRNGAHSGLILA